MIVVLLALLAWEPPKVICTSIASKPIYLGKDIITVEMKCCPDGSHIDDENHPADANGNLICSKEKA